MSSHVRLRQPHQSADEAHPRGIENDQSEGFIANKIEVHFVASQLSRDCGKRLHHQFLH